MKKTKNIIKMFNKYKIKQYVLTGGFVTELEPLPVLIFIRKKIQVDPP